MGPENFIESIEALSWLECPDGKERTISEDSETYLSMDDALLLVRELYSAGATEVLAQRVRVEPEFEDASSLNVILPQDPEARATLFAIEARVLREIGSPFESGGEQGQYCFGLGW
jgi:hypothetical protein